MGYQLLGDGGRGWEVSSPNLGAVPFSSCSATTGSADRGRWREPASLEEEDGPCGVRLACERPRDTSAMPPRTGKRRSAAHSSYSGHALSSET